jgi:hypothetical protein
VLGGHPWTGAAEGRLGAGLGLVLRRHLEADSRLGSGQGLTQAAGRGHKDIRDGDPWPGGCGPGAGDGFFGAAFLAAGFLGFFLSGGGRIRMFSHCVECP